MDLPHVVAQVLGALEGMIDSARAPTHGAREVTQAMSLHVTLQLILPVKELVRCTPLDPAFEDFGLLTSWWNGIDVEAYYQ